MAKAAIKRSGGRTPEQMRDVRVTYNAYGYGASSVLFEQGNTKVLCAVNMQQGVPPFLKGKKKGWLKAEYAMLPTSTALRLARETTTGKKNGRFMEISRLIGRCLRTMIDFEQLGEQTILVDCDVLQADGGTRTACITAASLALHAAVKRWLAAKKIQHNILIHPLAAISVGIKNGQPLLDIDFKEDSSTDADFNFVLTRSGDIVELQGTAERHTVSWQHFEQMRALAVRGVQDLFAQFEVRDPDTFVITHGLEEQKKVGSKKTDKVPLFSLANRLSGKSNVKE